MLDFDVGQVGFIEDIREIADGFLSMTEVLLDISGPFTLARCFLLLWQLPRVRAGRAGILPRQSRR